MQLAQRIKTFRRNLLELFQKRRAKRPLRPDREIQVRGETDRNSLQHARIMHSLAAALAFTFDRRRKPCQKSIAMIYKRASHIKTYKLKSFLSE